jgi:hypothetical protein
VDHGLNTCALAVVCACVVVRGLVAEKAGRWNISGPMAFVAMGLMLNNGPLAVMHVRLHSSTVRSLAEVALALCSSATGEVAGGGNRVAGHVDDPGAGPQGHPSAAGASRDLMARPGPPRAQLSRRSTTTPR